MILDLFRYKSIGNSIIGEFELEEEVLCTTLENKLKAIPEGRYPIVLRLWGGFHTRYSNRFVFHKGMIEFIVPARKYILAHIGNKYKDSKGCVLTGSSYNESSDSLLSSTLAYKEFYNKCFDDFGTLKVTELVVHNLF